MSSPFTFTWQQFQQGTGSVLAPQVKARLTRAARNPDKYWREARSAVVAPQMSIMGQTLWQCVEAAALAKFPDGTVPDQREIVMGLCYAAGLPYREAR